MVRNSIRNKMILFLLAAAVLPIVTSIAISFSLTRDKISRETIASNSALLTQGKANILNYLDGLQHMSLNAYNDEKLFGIIEYGYWDYLSEQEVYRAMQFMSHSTPGIEQSYLHMNKSGISVLIAHERKFVESGVSLPAYLPRLEHGSSFIEAPHPAASFGIGAAAGETPSDLVLTLHRSLYDVPSKKDLGYLAFDFLPNAIDTICSQLFERGREDIYIFDRKGTVVFAPDPALRGKALQAGWAGNTLAQQKEQGSFTWTSEGFSGFIIYEKMDTPYIKWTIAKRIPYDTLYRNARGVTVMNTIVVSLFLILSIIATVFISIRLTAPIKQLMRYMNQIQTGNLRIEIDMRRDDEFGILAGRFRTMMRTINDLILREYRLELASKTNELKALQAQVNPHFLNNALQSIGTLALQNGERKIYSLIASLAKMMRYNMNTNETTVSLAQEIDYVKAYFDLQQQRFGEGLQTSFNVESDAARVQVPKMILQPLAENFFKHGFTQQEAPASVELAAVLEDGGRVLRIEVKDNGRGVTEEKLVLLASRLEKTELPRTEGDGGIGLSNVHSRLKLFYGEQAGMRVDHVRPQGFTVTLWIPLTKEESSNESLDRG